MAIEEVDTRLRDNFGFGYDEFLGIFDDGDAPDSDILGTNPAIGTKSYAEERASQIYSNPETTIDPDLSLESALQALEALQIPPGLRRPREIIGLQIGAVIGLKQALENYRAKLEEIERTIDEESNKENPIGATEKVRLLQQQADELADKVIQHRRDLRESGADLGGIDSVAADLNRLTDHSLIYHDALRPLVQNLVKIERLAIGEIGESLPEVPGHRNQLKSNISDLTKFLQSSSPRKSDFINAIQAAESEEAIIEVFKNYRGIAIAEEVSDREIEDITISIGTALDSFPDKREFSSLLVGATNLVTSEITKRETAVRNAIEGYNSDISFRIIDRGARHPVPTSEQDFINAEKRRIKGKILITKSSFETTKRNLEAVDRSVDGPIIPRTGERFGGSFLRYISGEIAFSGLKRSQAKAAEEGGTIYTLEDSKETRNALECLEEYNSLLNGLESRIAANIEALKKHGANPESPDALIPNIGEPSEAIAIAREGLKDFAKIPVFRSAITTLERRQETLTTTHQKTQVAAQKAREEEVIRKTVKDTPEPVKTFAGRFTSFAGNTRLFVGRVFSAVGAKKIAKGFFDAAVENGKASGNKDLVRDGLRASFKATIELTPKRKATPPIEIDSKTAREVIAAVAAEKEAAAIAMEKEREKESSLETAKTPRRSVVASALRENLEAAEAAGLDMSKIAPDSRNSAMAGFKTLFRRDRDPHFLRFNPETGEIKLFKKGAIRSSTEVEGIFDESGILKEEYLELVKDLISGQKTRMQEALKEAEQTRETARVETIAKEEIAREETRTTETIETHAARIFNEFKRDENFSKLGRTSRRDGNTQLDSVEIAGKSYTLIISPDSRRFKLFEGRTELPVTDQRGLAVFEAYTKQSLGLVKGTEYALKRMVDTVTKAIAYNLESDPTINLHDSNRRGFSGWKDFGKTDGATHYARFRTDPVTGEIAEVKLFDTTKGRQSVEVPAFDSFGAPTKEFSEFLDRVETPIKAIERVEAEERAKVAEARAAAARAEEEARRIEAEAKDAEARSLEILSNAKKAVAEYRTTLATSHMPFLDNYGIYFSEDSRFDDPERPFCREADSEFFISVTKDFRSPNELPFKLYSQDGEEIPMFDESGHMKPEAKEIVDDLFAKYPDFIEAEKIRSAERDAKLIAIAKDHFAGKEDEVLALAGDDDHGYGEDLEGDELWLEIGKELELMDKGEEPEILSDILDKLETKEELDRVTAYFGEDFEAAIARATEIHDDPEHDDPDTREDIIRYLSQEIEAKERGEEGKSPTLDTIEAERTAAISPTTADHTAEPAYLDEVQEILSAFNGRTRSDSRDTEALSEAIAEETATLDSVSIGETETLREYADAKTALEGNPSRENLKEALSAMIGGGDSLSWETENFKNKAAEIGAKLSGNRVTMPAVTVSRDGPMRLVFVLGDDGKIADVEMHGGAKTMLGGEKERKLFDGDAVKPKHVSEVESLIKAYDRMLGIESAREPDPSHRTTSFVDRVTAQGHGKEISATDRIAALTARSNISEGVTR